MKPRRLPALVAAFGLVFAACGGGSDTGVASLEGATTTTIAESADVNTEEAFLEWAQCMRDNGIDVADPTVDADGNIQLPRPGGGEGEQGQIDRETAQAARQACEEYLETITLGARNRDDSEFQDLLLDFASCMREEGIDMPDPDFSTGTPGGPLGQIDRSDPAFQEGLETCGEILAGFGPGEGAPPPGGRGGGGGG
ncbi:MAG: hypothetical protein KJN71_04930 [Acidimicrobiia bacterium]|nr:hypothetical protein [Acidimicrobiia bacterium]